MLGFCPCCWPFPGGTGSPVFQRVFGGVAPFPVLLTASFSSHIHVAVCAGKDYRLCVSQTLLCLTLAGLEEFLGTLSSAPHEPGAGGPWVSGQWMVGRGQGSSHTRHWPHPGAGLHVLCLQVLLSGMEPRTLERVTGGLLRRDYMHTVL